MNNTVLTAKQKKTEFAWSMYDWANSAFALVITSAVFPVYYESITKEISKNGGKVVGESYYVDFLGFEFINTALYSYALSFAFLLIAILSPILSGISDVSGNKKGFMNFFCYLGCLSCATLFFFTENTLGLGIIAFIFGMIGFAGSIVFYNAFLPEITTAERFDHVSARGFSLGYLGSSILLILNILIVTFAENLGLSEGMAVRISFLTVGLWWFGFSRYTFQVLEEKKAENVVYSLKNTAAKGLEKLKYVWNKTADDKSLKFFLLSFFFTSMGLQTTMYIATLYGSKILNLESYKLIGTVLIIQFVAIAGAYSFSKISSILGNVRALTIAILIWVGICVYAYFLHSETGFYTLAAVVGLVMGGLQSLFRSSYAKLIDGNPQTQASFYSFYDVTEKIAIVFGTFAYGFIEEMTGSIRNSALTLGLFFLLGVFFIRYVTIKSYK